MNLAEMLAFGRLNQTHNSFKTMEWYLVEADESFIFPFYIEYCYAELDYYCALAEVQRILKVHNN